MLHSLQLENFKAFGQRTVIPLAPITLIFGANSSGKSSILQSLNLLKQTRESRDMKSLLLPRAENGIVDLGSFQEMIFDHEIKRTLSIRLDFKLEHKKNPFEPAPKFIRHLTTAGLEFAFSRKRIEPEITLEGFKLCGENHNSYIAAFEKCDSKQEISRYVGSALRSDRPSLSEMTHYRCVNVSADQSYWKKSFQSACENRSRYVESIQQSKREFEALTSNADSQNLFDEDLQSNQQEISRLLTLFDEHIRFFSSDFSLEMYIERMIQEQLTYIVAIDGFIPTFFGRPNNQFGIENFINPPLGNSKFRKETNAEIGASSVYAGRMIERNLRALFPLGPFRKPPSRWYVFTGTTPKDVGYQGHLLPDLLFRNKDILDDTNQWLKNLDIGYRIELKHLGSWSSDLFELRLFDTRRDQPVDVGLSDVGFGISQILPLIVQSLAASDQIISVEQPEVHIHPRLQADLADLLIEATKEPRRNQFIIETHSEHLALRLQRRVRDKTISPNDISIVYVSRGPNGAVVQPLRLDEDGDFMDEFPGGFFPERLRELR